MLEINKILPLANKIQALQAKLAELALQAQPIQAELDAAEAEMRELTGGDEPVRKSAKPVGGKVTKANFALAVTEAFGAESLNTEQLAERLGRTKGGATQALLTAKKKGLIEQVSRGVYRLTDQNKPDPAEAVMTVLRNTPAGATRDELARITRTNSIILDKVLEAADQAGHVYQPRPGLYKAK